MATAASTLRLPRPRTYRLALGLGIAGVLFGVTVGAIYDAVNGQGLTPRRLAEEGLAWLQFAITTPMVIGFTQHLARKRIGPWRSVAAHVVAFFVVLLLHTASYQALVLAVFPDRDTHWVQQTFNFARYDALLYPLVVVATLLTRQQRVTRRSELATARMARRVAEAELDHVRVRLDPYEVLTQLTEVEADLHRNPLRAERRLHEISRSLRRKLERIASYAPVFRPRRASHSDAPRDPRLVVFLISAAFAIYLTILSLLWRTIAGVTGWMHFLGTPAAFLAIGAFAAAMTPLFRRALAWSAQSRLRSLLAALLLLAAGVVQATAVELLMAVMRRWGAGRPPAFTFDLALMITAVSFYVVAVADLKTRRREARIRAESLAAAVAEARLRSLKTQLAPHFLFNTLNSVLSMLRQDAAGARLMLSRLRSLLRAVTEHHDRQEVTLAEDLDMTRSYLEIERVRFRDAVDVIIDVDERLLDAYVPAFLLQPLVENAIRHGALATLDRGTVHITVSRHGESLFIVVRNDGELLDPSGWQEGIGLSTTRARLAQIHGTDHELTIECDGESGVSVRIRLPLRRKTKLAAAAPAPS